MAKGDVEIMFSSGLISDFQYEVFFYSQFMSKLVWMVGTRHTLIPSKFRGGIKASKFFFKGGTVDSCFVTQY